MMTGRTFRPVSIGAVLVLSLIAMTTTAALAAIPGADDPNAYTYHRFREERLDFNRRSLVEAYKKVGNRDPKWDDDAIQALELLSQYFANGAVELIYKKPGPGWDDILKHVDGAVAAGCDDAMVVYARGAMLHDRGDAQTARPILEGALELARESKYPPHRAAGIAMRLTRFHNPRQNPRAGPAVQKLKETALELMEKAVSREMVGKDQRHVLALLQDEFDEASLDAKQKFVAKIEADPNTDPWILHVLKGKLHIRQGWAVRGGGFAHTVTDEGWKGFHEELAKAREHLTKAHELHPEYPEAANYMIEVAMGAGRAGETREWLDKAAKAQFDYYPAYNKYVWSIYPRWHGDHETMFEFGLECLKTARYDTYVPYQLMKVCEKIDNDSGKDFALYKNAQVYQAVKSMFEQLERKAPKHLNHGWYRTYHFGIAWRAGQYRDAAALVDKLGDEPNQDALNLVRGWAPFVLSEVLAMTSKRATQLSEAEAAFAGGQNYAAAISRYQDALATMEKDQDDPGLLFVRYRLKQLLIEKDFYDHKEVSLTPDHDLAPWYAERGDWKREKDGSLLGTTIERDGRGARLLCKADFGNHYELSAKVEWAEPSVPVACIYVGILEPYWSNAGIDRDGLVFMASGMESKKVPQPLKDVNELVVRVNGGRMSVKLNGADVGEIRMSQWQQKYVRIGLGIPNQQPGWAVRFSDVKIKSLRAATGDDEN